MYDSLTREIRITVTPAYLEEESAPEDDYFVWSYTIQIENCGAEVVQLKSRHWKITDATGQIHEVRGAGVVGEQPVLAPGDIYEYTSGTPLSTPSGFMVGAYQMETTDGEMFNVNIPAFSLDCPFAHRRVH